VQQHYTLCENGEAGNGGIFHVFKDMTEGDWRTEVRTNHVSRQPDKRPAHAFPALPEPDGSDDGRVQV
jgi:hypothetical protein